MALTYAEAIKVQVPENILPFVDTLRAIDENLALVPTDTSDGVAVNIVSRNSGDTVSSYFTVPGASVSDETGTTTVAVAQPYSNIKKVGIS